MELQKYIKKFFVVLLGFLQLFWVSSLIINAESVPAIGIPVVSDISNYGDSRDIEVVFTGAGDETNISEYRIIVVQSSQAGSFHEGVASSLTSDRYQVEAKTGANAEHRVRLRRGLLDSSGEPIVEMRNYKVYILSVGQNGYLDSLSAGSLDFRLLSPYYRVTNMSGNTALGSNNKRNMARDSLGNYYIVFANDYNGYGNHIYVCKSEDGGITWKFWDGNSFSSTGWAVPVDPLGNYNQCSPAIAVDKDDNIHIVWYGYSANSPSCSQIRYMRYANGVWSSVIDLTSENYNQSNPSIAVDHNNNIHIVWYGYSADSSFNQIRYIRYSNGVWSSVMNLTSGSYSQYNPSIAVDYDNNIHVVWYGYSPSSPYYQIRYMRYSGGIWSSAVDLTSGNYHQYNPSIGIDVSNNIYVVWYGYSASSPSYYQIRYMRYSGGIWSSAVDLTSGNYHQYNPSIGVDDNNNIQVVWYGCSVNSPSCSQIRYMRYSGGVWSSVIDLTWGGYSQNYPIMMEDGGGIVWVGRVDSSGVGINTGGITCKILPKVLKVEKPIISDVGNNGDSSDIQVIFRGVGNETNVREYRIFVVPEGEIRNFNEEVGINLPEGRYVIEPKRGANEVHNIVLPSGMLDTQGNPIREGISYKVFVLTIGEPGYSNSLSSGSSGLILSSSVPEVTPPTILNVFSTNSDGYYKVDDIIEIKVVFNEVVNVSGYPKILLETGTIDRYADYVSGSGTTTLTFRYIVQMGDSSVDLDYVSIDSLELNGGTIKDLEGNNAILTLPPVGTFSNIYNITIDTSIPYGSISINSNASMTNSVDVILTINAVDDNGVYRMKLSNHENFEGAEWEPYTTSKVWKLSQGDGVKTVYIKFMDAAGNESIIYKDEIILDTEIRGGIIINGGAIATSNRTVVLSIYGYEDLSGITEMMISNESNFLTASWEPYTQTKTWQLTEGDGEKVVYLKLKDKLGNVSQIFSDGIVLDTSQPIGSIKINDGSDFTYTSTVVLNIYAEKRVSEEVEACKVKYGDIGNEIVQMMISEFADFRNSIWEPYSLVKNFELSSNDGIKTVYVKFKDGLGNESCIYSDTIILDTTNPTGNIIINNGDEITRTRTVKLSINALDPNGVKEMMISNSSNFTGAEWETYKSEKQWELTDNDGIKTVYIKFRDISGRESQVYFDTIYLGMNSLYVSVPATTSMPDPNSSEVSASRGGILLEYPDQELEQDFEEKTKLREEIKETIKLKLKMTKEQIERILNEKLSEKSGNRLHEVEVLFYDKEQKVGEVELLIPGEVLKLIKTKGITKIVINSQLLITTVDTKFYIPRAGEILSLSIKRMDYDKENTVGYEIFGTVVNDKGLEKKIIKLNNEMDIKIPYSIEKNMEPEKLTVFYINENGTLENMSGAYNLSSKMIMFRTKQLGKYIVKYNNVIFTDISDKTARREIEIIGSKDIVKGRQKGKFEPKTVIKRCEFITLVARVLKLEENKDCSFKDVNPKQWYYGYVSAAEKAGLVKGYKDGRFKPQEYVTEKEMRVILERTVKIINPQISKKEYSKFIREIDLITQKNKYITRMEAARAIYRVFKLKMNLQ